MVDLNYIELQGNYGGQYVALQEDRIVATADTYDELINQMEQQKLNWTRIVIEYVEPDHAVGIY